MSNFSHRCDSVSAWRQLNKGRVPSTMRLESPTVGKVWRGGWGGGWGGGGASLSTVRMQRAPNAYRSEPSRELVQPMFRDPCSSHLS